MRTSLILALLLGAAARADEPAETWKAKCKSCHAQDGSADTKTGKKENVPDMRAVAWQVEWSDEDIRTVIGLGSPDNKKMKPFKDKLSAIEIDGLLQIIRGFRAGGALVQVAPPTPLPSASSDRKAVAFNADQPKAGARDEPRAEQNAAVPPVAPQPIAPTPTPAAVLPEAEPVKVTVKVSAAPEEPPADETGGAIPGWWLTLLAIALSIVALVVALKRKT